MITESMQNRHEREVYYFPLENKHLLIGFHKTFFNEKAEIENLFFTMQAAKNICLKKNISTLYISNLMNKYDRISTYQFKLLLFFLFSTTDIDYILCLNEIQYVSRNEIPQILAQYHDSKI